MEEVSLQDFLCMKSEEADKILVNINSCPVHIAGDFATRNANVKNDLKLCRRCDGTGNQLFSMYQKCENCGGTGISPEQPPESRTG